VYPATDTAEATRRYSPPWAESLPPLPNSSHCVGRALSSSGAVVDGRYKLLDTIGSGGTSVVSCAEDLRLGRKVALKVLNRGLANDQQWVERFRREACSAASLEHENIVSIYDRGSCDGTHYIAMEYVPGRSLKSIIREEAPLELARAIDLTVQILRAANFMHRRGIVHRDLKPANVLVDGAERLKVTDFGIARVCTSDITETGSILGTVQYLSPEQAQGRALSGASDLYSTGIVLYELLAARVPFNDESVVAVAMKHVNQRPAPPSEFNPAVTPALDTAVMRALEKDPARRFPDADAFIAALEQAKAAPASADPVRAAGLRLGRGRRGRRRGGVRPPAQAALAGRRG
jgi:eukaryotic-like serine/threonine-protein kinase